MNDKHHNAPATLGTVVLGDATVALESETGKSFISDCARNTEGLLSDLEIRIKYGVSDKDWVGLAGNGLLISAVQAERERRVAGGEAAREAAQRHYSKAPDVLGGILTNTQISPRHRIEAAKELRQASSNSLETATGPTEKFIININLGDDELIAVEKHIGSRNPLPDCDGEPQ